MDAVEVVNSYELGRVINAMSAELSLRPKNLWRVVLRTAAVENLVAMVNDRRLGVWSDQQFVTKHAALLEHLEAQGTATLRTAVDSLSALLRQIEDRERG